MRITALLPALLTAFWASSAWAEEVLYYGNGWPISLVERACDGDEGCLTQLANCEPGTDGTCGTQVASCSVYVGASTYTSELCVVDLRPDDTGRSLRVIFSETLAFLDLTATQDAPCGFNEESDTLVCIRLIISQVELDAWAARPIE